VEAVVKYLNGERQINKLIYTPAVLITIDNVDKYYDPNALSDEQGRINKYFKIIRRDCSIENVTLKVLPERFMHWWERMVLVNQP